LERGDIVDPHYSTLSGLAAALDTSVGSLIGETVTAGKAEAPPQGSSSTEEPEERRERIRKSTPLVTRVRILHEVAHAFETLNGLYAPEVERGEKALTEERYELVGEEFVRLSNFYADYVSASFFTSSGASENGNEIATQEEREALNHAWSASYDLQNTLQRAYTILTQRGVTVVQLFKRAAG
jgi:hypothetical protein